MVIAFVMNFPQVGRREMDVVVTLLKEETSIYP